MTTVTLTGNFLATARCLTFADGGGISWNFNSLTNTLTGSATSGGTFLSSVGFADASTAPIFTVSNSPLTANGTLDIALKTQAAKSVLCGPTTGSAAQPTFRALVASDIPSLGANPSASVGLSAVNGTAATFMTSDSAPALSQAIVPTWTGTHTFNTGGTAVVVDCTGATIGINVKGLNSSSAGVIGVQDGQTGARQWTLNVGAAGAGIFSIRDVTAGSLDRVTISTSGAVTIVGNFACNNASPPAQSTGWGTPTGAIVNNYNGSAATLLQTSDALGQLLSVLKAIGILGT